MGIIIKTKTEIELMRKAGKILAAVMDKIVKHVEPGIKTIELDRLAETEIFGYGACPSFKDYKGYPANICVSINDEIVHGIPGERVIKPGDIVSIDGGVIYNGFQADMAVTVGVGVVSPQAERLIKVTREALNIGIQAARRNSHLGSISAAIQKYTESQGFCVVREYSGHGIGRELHEDPLVPNFGQNNQGPILKDGMTLALEPMVNAGGWQTRIDENNNWTVLTKDGTLSAHFEHTIVIDNNRAEVLTVIN